MTGLVAVSRPETGTVGSQHFITDDDVAILIKAKFKLGISDNDSSLQCVLGTGLVKLDGFITELYSIRFTLAGEIFLQVSNALFKGNVLVMIADLRLCGGSINRFRKLVGFL